MKLYIAGQKFAGAEAALRDAGHEPVNPMRENGLGGDGKEYPWAE